MEWDEQEYLRGRMGGSFYGSMGLSELVARSRDEYVNIAVRLGVDAVYRCGIVHAMKVLGSVIWRREEVVREWELFLMTSVSYSKAGRLSVRAELEAAQRRDSDRVAELRKQLDANVAPLICQPSSETMLNNMT